MVLGNLEIIVLIFVVLGLLKLIFVLFSPKSWFGFAKGLYKSPAILIIVEIILALIVFYYLLQTMTIVQIMGGVVLGALLTGLSFAFFAKDSMAWAGKLLNAKGFFKKMWLVILIWLALFIWTLIAMF